VLPIAANDRSPATIRFWLFGICRPRTINHGRIPIVQSAQTFNADTAYVRPTTMLGLMQLFACGSRDHQSAIGQHWKTRMKENTTPRQAEATMRARMMKMWILSKATRRRKKPTEIFRRQVERT
jgi:hypothetical protein